MYRVLTCATSPRALPATTFYQFRQVQLGCTFRRPAWFDAFSFAHQSTGRRRRSAVDLQLKDKRLSILPAKKRRDDLLAPQGSKLLLEHIFRVDAGVKARNPCLDGAANVIEAAGEDEVAERPGGNTLIRD